MHIVFEEIVSTRKDFLYLAFDGGMAPYKTFISIAGFHEVPQLIDVQDSTGVSEDGPFIFENAKKNILKLTELHGVAEKLSFLRTLGLKPVVCEDPTEERRVAAEQKLLSEFGFVLRCFVKNNIFHVRVGV